MKFHTNDITVIFSINIFYQYYSININTFLIYWYFTSQLQNKCFIYNYKQNKLNNSIFNGNKKAEVILTERQVQGLLSLLCVPESVR